MTELLTEEGHRLRLEGEPRVGGESRVYEARGPSGERWAVKLALLPLPAGRWLHEEYELLRELGEDPRTAPHVARVRGRGHWGDRPFVALDWYPDTLATWVTRDPPVADRLAMARVVAQAVDALHDARPGLCHRDVKPSNVLLGPDGDVRLADFGAARAARPGATTTTTAVFSEGFAAPELTLPVPARPARHQDVYALAATVFFTLVGHAPAAVARSARALTPAGRALRGDHAGAAPPIEACFDFDRAAALTPADRAALRRRVDGPLEAVLARALAPRPDRRDVTAREIAGALAASRPWSPRRWPLLAVLAAIAGAALLARPSPAPYADVLVPGGTVTLGDPAGAYPLEPRRTVEIAPFRLGAGEVHQALWREVTGIDPSSHRVFDGGLGMYCTTYAGVDYVGDDLPVVCVDLAGVARFANALSERHGLDPAYTIEEVAGEEAPLVRWDRGANGWRLPTGDEWEHAARAGRTGRIEVDDSADLCAWQNGRDLAFLRLSPRTDDALGCDDGYAGPAPVGAFPPNAWGLRSMTGNVAEWVWDPAGRQRGTSFEGGEEHLRLSFTMSRPPETRALGIGFRLARAP